MKQRQALLIGVSIVAGLVASRAPVLAFALAGGALLYFREAASELVWRYFQGMPYTTGPDGRPLPSRRPGRNLCRFLVLTTAGWCFAIALYSII